MEHSVAATLPRSPGLFRAWRTRVGAIGLGVFGTLPLAGCGPATIVDALTPDDGYVLSADIAYGPERRQRLDIYSPEDASTTRPVVVFFYGGGLARRRAVH